MRYTINAHYNFGGRRGQVTVGREDEKNLAVVRAITLCGVVALDTVDKVSVYESRRMKEVYARRLINNEWVEIEPNS